MEFRILGPLQVLDRGVDVPLGSPKERALLAVLLLHIGEVVSRERLIDELWGESPPPTAAKAVNVHVSQLRKALAINGCDPVATLSGGYALEVEPTALDATVFEQLLADARQRSAAGDVEAAVTILRDALALWRGHALAGIALESTAGHEVQRLEELRLAALLDRIDCDLALGRHEDVVAELESLTARHPLRERLRGQYMLALYRSGRQVDALRAYQDARRMLVDELGLEPSPALLRLQKAILNHDRALEAPGGIAQSELEPRLDEAAIAGMRIGVARAGAAPAGRRGPHLPTATSILIGRRRELEELAALLTGPGRLVTVTGPGGIGKTRLALAAAERIVDTFAEGASFVSLAALRHERHVAAAVVSPFGVRDFDELHEREALLIVDNFEHLLTAAPVVSALLAAAPRSKVLVTSRSPLRIAGEYEYPLAPLAEDDALALLADRARAVRPAFAADDASREICRRLDCLPLALELAATHLRSLGPAALLERLQPRLPLLSDGRRDAPERQRTLRATIEWSYLLLDPDLQRRFAGLSVFAGTFSLSAAEAVVGATLEQVERLVEASLLTPVVDDRFSMLETIREFASEQVDADDLEALRAHHAGFFAAVAEDAGLSVESEVPMEHSRAFADLDNFRVALDWAAGSGRNALSLRLATALGPLWVTTDPIGAMRLFERLLAASDDEDPGLRPRALYLYAVLTSIVGDWEQVERLAKQTLTEARAAGDDGSAANALLLLALCAARVGDYTRAQALAEQSLLLYRSIGSRKGEAQVYGLLGSHHLAAGEYTRGLELIDRAITLAHEAGFPWWEKNELCFLAEHLLAFGQTDDAGERALRALRIAVAIHDRVGQLDALAILAHVAAERGEPSVAGRLWGAVESEAARAPFPGWERTRHLHAAAVSADAAFEAARADGAELTLGRAVDEMLHGRS